MLIELLVKGSELCCRRARPIRPKQRTQLAAQILVRPAHLR